MADRKKRYVFLRWLLYGFTQMYIYGLTVYLLMESLRILDILFNVHDGWPAAYIRLSSMVVNESVHFVFGLMVFVVSLVGYRIDVVKESGNRVLIWTTILSIVVYIILMLFVLLIICAGMSGMVPYRPILVP